ISNQGGLDWLSTYDGPAQAEDEATSITFSNDGSELVLISGLSDGFPAREADGILLAYDITSGINSLSLNKQLMIYPNPATDIVRWSPNSDFYEVRCMDALGRTVLGSTGTAISALDVSSLPSGIYRLMLSNADEVVVVPLSINHHD
ncbi:MAG: T9SS type A sorting domain-containing protein, partial [Bacteroidota bacterium]